MVGKCRWLDGLGSLVKFERLYRWDSLLILSVGLRLFRTYFILSKCFFFIMVITARPSMVVCTDQPWRHPTENITICRGSDSLRTLHKHEQNKMVYQPCKQEPKIYNDVKMADTTLANVARFTYLRSTVTSHAKLDVVLQKHMEKVSANFGRLNDRLWRNKLLAEVYLL